MHYVSHGSTVRAPNDCCGIDRGDPQFERYTNEYLTLLIQHTQSMTASDGCTIAQLRDALTWSVKKYPSLRSNLLTVFGECAGLSDEETLRNMLQGLLRDIMGWSVKEMRRKHKTYNQSADARALPCAPTQSRPGPEKCK